MGRRPWYKRYPSNFISGTLHLTLEQKGAYSMVLDLIYDRGGPIPDDAQWIARVCGCSTRKWNQIRTVLIGHGHLAEIDGRLTNERAEKEILSGENEREKLSENGVKGAEKTNENRASRNDNSGLAQKGPHDGGRQVRSQKPDTRDSIPSSVATSAPEPAPPDDEKISGSGLLPATPAGCLRTRRRAPTDTGVDFSDSPTGKANRKARWQQKVIEWGRSQLDDEAFMQWQRAWLCNEPWAAQQAEAFDAEMRSAETRKQAEHSQ